MFSPLKTTVRLFCSPQAEIKVIDWHEKRKKESADHRKCSFIVVHVHSVDHSVWRWKHEDYRSWPFPKKNQVNLTYEKIRAWTFWLAAEYFFLGIFLFFLFVLTLVNICTNQLAPTRQVTESIFFLFIRAANILFPLTSQPQENIILISAYKLVFHLSSLG